MSAVTLMIGAAILIPAMLLTEGVPGWHGTAPGLAILFLGLVPTALAALLRISVIKRAGPGFMTMVNYQVPLWSMAFGAIVLNEALPHRFFAALALILAGLAISQIRTPPDLVFGPMIIGSLRLFRPFGNRGQKGQRIRIGKGKIDLARCGIQKHRCIDRFAIHLFAGAAIEIRPLHRPLPKFRIMRM